MAEGYAKVFLKDQYEVRSPGLEAQVLNPNAIEVMKEDGIDINHQKSKVIDLSYFNSADLIVTLCGDARDKCPVASPNTMSIHWPLLDPAKAKGTRSQKLVVFRQVRDEIKQLVCGLKNNSIDE